MCAASNCHVAELDDTESGKNHRRITESETHTWRVQFVLRAAQLGVLIKLQNVVGWATAADPVWFETV